MAICLNSKVERFSKTEALTTAVYNRRTFYVNINFRYNSSVVAFAKNFRNRITLH